MENLLTRKFESFAPLSDADRHLLDDIVRTSRSVEAHQDIIREGDAPSNVHLVLKGFACRYKLLKNGRRQIVAYLVPGDFCDLNIFVLSAMDHNIGTLSPCTVVDIPRSRILEMTERPALARACWWATLVDEATLREWLLNLGQRDAATRIGHLICELLLRLRAVGLADGNSYELPLSQNEIADTMGLTTVHVNRSLQALRQMGLITFKSRHIVIADPERLIAYSGFNPNYLHLRKQNGVAHQPS